jgi:electron transfer flavoprotein-quinone oxidoreductase
MVVGVRTGRPAGDVYAEIVVLADGVNSLLATKAGLFRRPVQKQHYSIGIKELLALPADIINERFGLEGNAGAAYMAVGEFCRNIPGGAFLYTNKESLSVGIVAQPEALGQQKITLDEVLEKFKERKEIARLIRDAKLLEYSAHLIPEGGYNEMPALHANGLLVAGDAAGFVVNTGLVLMGMNLAIDSGRCAGEAAKIVLGKGKSGHDELGNTYEKLLSKSAALSAMRVHKNAPKLVNSPRIFNEYPDMINNVLQSLVEIKPGEQQGFFTIAKGSIKGIKLMDMIRDVIVGVRAL